MGHQLCDQFFLESSEHKPWPHWLQCVWNWRLKEQNDYIYTSYKLSVKVYLKFSPATDSIVMVKDRAPSPAVK